MAEPYPNSPEERPQREKNYTKLLTLPLLGVLLGLVASAGGETMVARPRVITTVAPLTDLVQQVGGSLIDLHGLIPEGADAHTYEAAPSDAQWIAEADVVVLNGLHLEGTVEKLINANRRPTATVLRLGDETVSPAEWIFDAHFPKTSGFPNPHLWLNVEYTMRYLDSIGTTLERIDPLHRPAYTVQTARMLQRLKTLDAAIAEAIKTIPPPQRKLFTYHDAWVYFARRYNLPVISALQPEHFAEPSPKEVATLIDQLRREQVPAIFGSEVFPTKVLQQIGQEAGVRWIKTLRDDTLPGVPGEPRHSYLGMMLENARTIVQALGGDPTPLNGIALEGKNDRSH
ncbi:MAG: zinc ABC transporter substrate-binding protein [Elusimicrobia bacterium]|nr:zinc ABC transporter substrate-binding protein [Elusimicrobiota bacterium]